MLFDNQQDTMQIGLSGFFRNLWNGFKSAFTKTESDDAQSNAGGFIGRLLGKFAKAFVAASTIGVVSKQSMDYEPTTAEKIVLDPLVNSLNNWLIAKTNEINNLFKSNASPEVEINAINNVIRVLQIISEYYSRTTTPGLSSLASTKLSEEVEVMIMTFEATTEDLLNNNGIDFIKTDGNLKLNNNESPVPIPTTFLAKGIQYSINQNAGSISTDVPTSSTLEIAEATGTHTTTSGTATTQTSKPKVLGLVLIGAALLLLFSKSKK